MNLKCATKLLKSSPRLLNLLFPIVRGYKIYCSKKEDKLIPWNFPKIITNNIVKMKLKNE